MPDKGMLACYDVAKSVTGKLLLFQVTYIILYAFK